MILALEIQSIETASGETQAAIFVALVESLIAANLIYLVRFPRTPPLYLSGVRYVETPVWKDVPALLRSGFGDCKSLVAWRIAELRNAGRAAFVHVILSSDLGRDTFHITARTIEGVEDPSAKVPR